MDRILLIPALALALLAGGCTQTVNELVTRSIVALTYTTNKLSQAKAYIDTGCGALYARELSATPNCAVKLSKLRAGVDAICRNSAYLTDDKIGNYSASVVNAVKKSQAAGC
ncbi:MAG: hypothetical protein M3X11_26205 [Acidobacteriota bacterium]|nr:hypothetical protein [Acidobacteriota bacterium]